MPTLPLPLYDESGPTEQPERYSYRNGCHALLWAVLHDVFSCQRLPSRAARKQMAKDQQWVASESEAPFSFVWTCRQLDLDPSKVRRAYGSGQTPAKPYHRAV